ncbi:hypothetical protein BS78_01G361900 [Paspalum vaginatum]|nr:hypothetical protein BS78_01G361900 [Paspalum vaginatum]
MLDLACLLLASRQHSRFPTPSINLSILSRGLGLSRSLNYHYQPAPAEAVRTPHTGARTPTPTPLSRRGCSPPAADAGLCPCPPPSSPALLHTMTAPKWFQKLRRRRKSKQQQTPCSSAQAAAEATTTSAARTGGSPSGHSHSHSQWPCPPAVSPSPNRASYYFASADRARQDRELPCAADAALDVRVDVVHRRAGAGAQRLSGLDAPPGTPELKLRRIVTRARHPADCSESGSASATTSAATTPSTRARGFHVKPAAGSRRRRRRRERDASKKGKAAAAAEEDEASLSLSPSSLRRRRRRRRLWLYESLVVVKASSDPERELAESMAEMVVANGIRSSEDLEELLACYLALNAAEHHHAVVAAFRHVWRLLDRHSLLL